MSTLKLAHSGPGKRRRRLGVPKPSSVKLAPEPRPLSQIEKIEAKVREHLKPRTDDQLRESGKKQRTAEGDLSDNPDLDLELGILREQGIKCCGSYTLNDTCPKCFEPLRRRA